LYNQEKNYVSFSVGSAITSLSLKGIWRMFAKSKSDAEVLQ
jgi:hypothetical protein